MIVADPNFAPTYSTRSRRVKTDRRDAMALMDACRQGNYRSAHRTSEPQRRVRPLLTVRDNLVRTRVRQIQVVRALLRREGLRVRSGQTASFGKRVDEVETSQWLRDIIAPLRAVMDGVSREMAVLDTAIEQVVEGDPVVQRLCTAPGIGPVTAVAFVSTLDQVQRFEGAHKVEAYIGLVPSEFSSGERQHRGAITNFMERGVRGVRGVRAGGVEGVPETKPGPPPRLPAVGTRRRLAPPVSETATERIRAQQLLAVVLAPLRISLPQRLAGDPRSRLQDTTVGQEGR